jgi:hypothetical protein
MGTSFAVVHAAALVASMLIMQDPNSTWSMEFFYHGTIPDKDTDSVTVVAQSGGPSDSRCRHWQNYYEDSGEYGEKFYYQPWGKGTPQNCADNACKWGKRPVPHLPSYGSVKINNVDKYYSDWNSYYMDEFCACNPAYYASKASMFDNGYYASSNARPEGWCHARSFPAASDKIECTICPIGSYCPGGIYFSSVSSCDGSCSDRCRYFFHRGMSTCTTCGPGTYVYTSRQWFVDNMFIGDIDPCSKEGSNHDRYCATCPGGKYSDSDNLAGNFDVNCNDCRTTCSLGYYLTSGCTTTQNAGCSLCRTCTDGYREIKICDSSRAYVDANNNGDRLCQLCEAGKKSSIYNVNVYINVAYCTECAAYEYSNAERTQCISCGANEYPDRANSRCAPCPPGSFSLAGDAGCTPCNSPGWFWNSNSNLAVTEQDCRNTYSDAAFLIQFPNYDPCYSVLDPFALNWVFRLRAGCLACPKGKSQIQTGQTSCNDCTGVTMQDRPGQASCKICPIDMVIRPNKPPARIGMYRVSATHCDNCEAGKFWASETVGTIECTLCAQGKYQPLSAATTCIDCQPKTYNPSTGQAQCSPCQKGKYCPTPATINPIACPIGSFANQEGSSACQMCILGNVSTTDRISCSPCAADKQIVADPNFPYGNKGE